MPWHKNWLLFAIGSAVFAALTAVLGKVGVRDVDSNFAVLFRTIVIVPFAAIIVSATSAWPAWNALSPRSIIFLVLSGLATGLSWLCYYRALQLGPASRVAPVDKLSVVLAMLLAYLFLGEGMSWRLVLGGILITTGVVIIALPEARNIHL